MTETDPAYRVSDFAELLCREPRPLLVAGQAVNLWAMVYARTSEALVRMQPFVSRDCDLLGDTETVRRLASASGWQPTYSPRGAPSPVVGVLNGYDAHGRTLTVEVLSSIRGLSAEDLQSNAVVELDGRRYCTLTPVVLLKAKLANVIDFPQDRAGARRNDLVHVKILVPCVAGYLTDAHQHGIDGILTERGVTNLLERTLDVVASDNARRVSARYGLGFLECLPLDTSPLAKVRSFVAHRLTRLRGEGRT